MRGNRALAIGVQIFGFAVCVAIAVWVVRVATTGEQGAALSQLREISLGRVGLLLGLSVSTLVLNGVLFWIAAQPARWSNKVTLLGVFATNAVATMLAYLPFKLSAAARMAIHHRRDGLSLTQMVAWFACFFAAMGGTIGPLAVASVWRGELDEVWLLAAGSGVAFCFVVSVVVARVLGAKQGHRWLARVCEAGPWKRVLTSERVEQLHEAFVMVGCARWLAVAYGVRVVDLLVQSARFDAAATAIGQPMGLGSSVVAAAGYYGMLVASPFGALGAREAGAVGAGSMLAEGAGSLAATTLVVTGAEAATLLTLGVAAMVWIGPGVWRGRLNPEALSEVVSGGGVPEDVRADDALQRTEAESGRGL